MTDTAVPGPYETLRWEVADDPDGADGFAAHEHGSSRGLVLLPAQARPEPTQAPYRGRATFLLQNDVRPTAPRTPADPTAAP